MNMKRKLFYVIPLLAGIVTACSQSLVSTDYDASLCEELSMRIERRDSLSQDDYARMIGQNEAILKYLVEQTKKISEEPDSVRGASWRLLTAEPEYLERFGYMFTIGSALYSAQLDGLLDKNNLKNYEKLDRYNNELIEYTDR